MTRLTRITTISLLVLLLLMAWGWFNIWRSPSYYVLEGSCESNGAILSMDEYGAVFDTHARPFIVNTSQIVVFGAEHTKDPKDAQLSTIRTTWDALDPTVALVEGRLGFFIPYVMDPVKEYGESGFVAALAKANGAKLYSWELPRSELIAQLLRTFDAEKVALQQILSPYFSAYRFGPPEDANQFVQTFLNRAGYPGLENTISSIEDIDRIWRRDFSGRPDWRETSDEFGLPGYLADIAAEANLLRNQHLTCIIDELKAAKERIFVICGSSHAVCIAPAIQ